MNIYAVAVLSALHVGVPAANGARRRLDADSGGLVEVDLSNIQGSSERLRRHYEEMSREPAHDSEEVHSVQDSEEIHDSVHDSEEVHDSEGNDSEEVHASVQDSEEVHISSHDSVHDSEEPIGHADSEEPRTWLTAPSPPLACASVNPATGDTCYPPGPPLPPLLPLRDGEVLATTAQEIQDEIDAAFLEGRNASVYLQSGALIRFTREVVCSSSIHLSVRSSGSGARLQAEGRTRMFRIGNGWSSEAATGSLSLEAVHFLVGTAADNGEKGGALYAYTGSIVMKDVSFTDCWAADQGGAIFAHTIGSIVLTDVRFTNCLAGFGGGGALFALGGGTISMTAVAFDNCGCDEGDGGAVYTDSAGGISLIGVAFTDCHARRIGSGGALYAINFGDLTMTDVAFLGCSAVVAGGAVVAGIFTGAGAADITTTGVTGVQPSGDISLSGVSFTNCSSANAYGAIAIFDVSGNVSVTRTRVVNCRATARSGAFYVLAHSRPGEGPNLVALSHTAFVNNTGRSYSALGIEQHGGQGTRATMRDVSFAGNGGNNGAYAASYRANTITDWHCRLGSWMTPSGDFLGDFDAPACRPCAAGQYGRAHNLTVERCTGPCPEGHFCEAGTTDPEPCPTGTWMPFTGAVSNASCLPCRPGQYQDREGQLNCVACPPGSFSSGPGSATCELCPPGGYCEAAGAATSMVWNACPAGTYNANRGADSSAACTPCPPGTSQPKPGATSSRECKVCSAGTSIKFAGQQCLPCPHPLDSEKGSVTCTVCKDGYFMEQHSSVDSGVPQWRGASGPATCDKERNATRMGEAACLEQLWMDYGGNPTGSDGLACGYAPIVAIVIDRVGWTAPSWYTSGGGVVMIDAMMDNSAECQAHCGAKEGCDFFSYKWAQTDGIYYHRCYLKEGYTEDRCTSPNGWVGGESTPFVTWTDPADDILASRAAEICKHCPTNAECSAFNTTLESLGVPRGFWRASSLTTELHKCVASKHCSGSGKGEHSSRRLAASAPSGGAHGEGCDAGHTGPLCEWCTSETQFFDRAERGCTDCPSTVVRFGILTGAVAAAAGAALLLKLAFARNRARGRYHGRLASQLAGLSARVGLQPKVKILVSFYQIAVTLGPLYGVRLHDDFTRWTDFIDEAFNFDALGLSYPPACLGSMRNRLLLGALWPYAAILLGAAALAARAAVKLLSDRADKALRRTVCCELLRLVLRWAILVAFFVLPPVSRSIFRARQCESYNINVFTGERRSYLVADLDVLCSTDDDEYRGLDAYFWAFFVLWPVLVPLAFLALLLWIRSEVRAQRITPLATACRFLWRDYEVDFLFWEVFDLGRKLVLASLVLFIDLEYGSSKLLRLVVASVISAFYLAALALARPFKRADNLHLACIANLILTCCFVLGTAIQICEGVAYDDMCHTLVGLTNGRSLSVITIALTTSILAISVLVVTIKTATAVGAPTIRLVSSGRPPALELPPECHYHGFFSHAWGTGQDQTHTCVRQLQQLLPGVRIWLDVDCLDDVGRLEESVADSATFLVFLSAGYFESWNCRRELYAALASDRPFIAVHEADTSKGGAPIAALQAECNTSCVEVAPQAHPSYSGPEELLAKIFDLPPIMWVRVHDFQIESLKEISLRMLRHSQHYRSGSLLAAGVAVPSQVGPYALHRPVTILVCRDNNGARNVAEEVAVAAEEGGRSLSRLSAPSSTTSATRTVVVREAEGVLCDEAPPTELETDTVLLLYLTSRTFLDEGGTVARMVQTAMDRRIPIALVAEQEPSRGGCPFAQLLQQTPRVLQQPPYKLYDTLAVPLFPSVEHRRVSLRHILRSMGAVPCDARALTRCLHLCRRRIGRLLEVPTPGKARLAGNRLLWRMRPGACSGGVGGEAVPAAVESA